MITLSSIVLFAKIWSIFVIANWFLMSGIDRQNFDDGYLVDEDLSTIIIFLLAGPIAFAIVICGRTAKWIKTKRYPLAWRPYNRKEKDQIRLLKKLENS